ncbi:MAG: patatin-like phospholipase family protein [Steroidobacteraceae bacterium]
MGNCCFRLGLAFTLVVSGAWNAGAGAGAAVPDAVRPRVCLVLSGGGARGMAHIGVLKVLEELQVPIDCIAGTSMGAVVGGLYASGMTTSEIDATMRSVDWQDAFRDAPPRQDLAFRRKQDDRNFLVRLPLGLKHGHLLLPKGFIQGQQLQETLRQLTLSYAESASFDRLPTPFRAVATDLETGDAVVLDKGDLALTMRASISAPGLFAPVEYQGRLLVDGGISENLPIDVARAMHADIIIVSDVSFPLQPRKQLDSALAISNQMLAILVRKDTNLQKATLGPQDILIEPALGLAASTDFTFAAGLVVKGEAAAREAKPRLMALRVDDRTYQAYLSRRAAREPALPTIRFVQVDEQSKRYEATILAEMQPLIGKPLDVDALDARIKNLYGLGYFETLDYSVVERGGGGGEESGLEIRARRKSWGPTYVRFGLNLQDDFQGNNYYNATARFLMSEINSLGAELSTDVQVGSDPKLTSELYQPLDALHTWFVAPSARIEGRDLPIYANNTQIADFRDREVEGDVDFGRNLGNWGEIRVGVHRINGLEYDRWGNPDLVTPQYNNGEYFFKFTYDQLDNVRFPSDGQTFSLQWDANRANLGADVAFDRVTADWLMARSSGRNTLLLWTSAGATLDGNLQPTDVQDFYSLGGFLNLSGLAPLSLLGPNFAIARAIYFRKISRGGEGFFEVPAYLGMSLEAGNTWEHRGEMNYASAHKDASVFVAFDTFLGPVYLGTGYDNSGYAGYYLFLGRTF